ncbi:hypothetical protein HG530_003135 [Fusarium avenaceum]|nr:hypothetical protein HG530_003135 [Fusarium avenaceum]
MGSPPAPRRFSRNFCETALRIWMVLTGTAEFLYSEGTANPSVSFRDRSGVGVHAEDDRHSKSILFGSQRANLGGQLRRQQCAEAVLELNGSTSLLSLTIHKGVGLDKVSNVSNVNTDLNLAIGTRLDMDGIAELSASVVVNCEGGFIAVITTLSNGSLILLLKRPVLKTDATKDGIRKLIRSKVVVAEESIGLNLKITHTSKLLNKGSEGVERSDGPALYAGHKDSIRIVLVLLDKVAGGLLSGDSNKGYTLVGRLEPNNLGLLLLARLGVARVAAFTGSPLSLLLLFGSLTAGAEQAESTGKHLTSNTLNDSNNMASVQRLLLIVDFLLFNKEETLALNFNVIVLLLGRALAQTTTTAESTLRRVAVVVVARVLVTLIGGSRSGISDILALLLLLLLALLAPNFINIQKLDGNQIALKSTVSVLATADKDISIKEAILGGDISIATVLLVDTEDAGNELAISQKSRERSLRKIRCKKGLALLLLLLTTHLTSMLRALETHELLTVHLGGFVARLILALSLSTPVTFKVARSAASVAATAALKFVTLSVQATATASSIDSHALAATMTTTPTAGRSLSNRDIKGTARRGLVLVTRGRRSGE